MRGDWLNNIYDRYKVLFDDAYYLKGLAKSFRNLGNTKVSDNLETIADNMFTTQKEISGNIAQMLSDQVNAGQKEMRNLITAIIAKQEAK